MSFCPGEGVLRGGACIGECLPGDRVPRWGSLALVSVWLGMEWRDVRLALVSVWLRNRVPRWRDGIGEFLAWN